MFSTLDVSKFDTSITSNFKQDLNIDFILTTLPVFKFAVFKVLRFVHPSNMLSIFVT